MCHRVTISSFVRRIIVLSLSWMFKIITHFQLFLSKFVFTDFNLINCVRTFYFDDAEKCKWHKSMLSDYPRFTRSNAQTIYCFDYLTLTQSNTRLSNIHTIRHWEYRALRLFNTQSNTRTIQYSLSSTLRLSNTHTIQHSGLSNTCTIQTIRLFNTDTVQQLHCPTLTRSNTGIVYVLGGMSIA